MSWITKQLTLDLLAITIDGMNKIFNRINQEEEDTTPVSLSAWADTTDTTDTTPPQAENEAEETPAPEQEGPTEADTTELLAEAQNLLRTIAQTTGTDWITGTLFPHFNTQSLMEIPPARLPEVITLTKSHIQETA